MANSPPAKASSELLPEFQIYETTVQPPGICSTGIDGNASDRICAPCTSHAKYLSVCLGKLSVARPIAWSSVSIYGLTPSVLYYTAPGKSAARISIHLRMRRPLTLSHAMLSSVMQCTQRQHALPIFRCLSAGSTTVRRLRPTLDNAQCHTHVFA
eukprot:6190081-Pleurochrysis_carterae.AAC.3